MIIMHVKDNPMDNKTPHIRRRSTYGRTTFGALFGSYTFFLGVTPPGFCILAGLCVNVSHATASRLKTSWNRAYKCANGFNRFWVTGDIDRSCSGWLNRLFFSDSAPLYMHV